MQPLIEAHYVHVYSDNRSLFFVPDEGQYPFYSSYAPAKRDQFFIMAGVAPDPEKAMFKSPTFQVLIELFYDISR